MPQKISPEAFFERASNNVAIEKKKDIVNGKQVLKELQPKTKKNYARALALWDQYKKLNPGYYKDFTAGWRRARIEEEQQNEETNKEGEKERVIVISPNVTLSTSNH
ncbi:hypothetical protein BCR34DRAFT_594254 [Clohesyomyces aquaticus]|uniref:Uncharacterized protein n=1 Tax=Clohesyomyces aquaticus TaxID=1231657 RepID=A0A1Y1YBE0_9PLEO|nr:hypothetical protein BCR34DRAFT_594254 [Clohesyomyces aquaticus]